MSASNTRETGVGMFGYGFMGEAHSNAFRKVRALDERLARPRRGQCDRATRGRRLPRIASA
jgi:hypothetical protein